MELLPGAEKINAEDRLEQDESGSDVDSDLSNDELPYLPTLEKVKLYLVSSTAYSELKQQLAELVRPSCTTYRLPSNDKPGLANMDLRSDKVVIVGEGDLATEESKVSSPVSNTKSDVSFSRFGSLSMEDVGVVWNAVLDTHHQNEKERLRNFDMENLSLKRMKPKHGRLEEISLLSKLWVAISLAPLSLTLRNLWTKWRRRSVRKVGHGLNGHV